MFHGCPRPDCRKVGTISGALALIFGLSEPASATAHRLAGSGWRVALAADAPPKVHRRRMSLADVWWDGEARLGGIACRRVAPETMLRDGVPQDGIAFLALDPEAALDLAPWSVAVDGVGRERIVYAPAGGALQVLRDIGETVARGETVASIGDYLVAAPLSGTLRGMLRDGIAVQTGDTLCEVDPRPAALAIFHGIGQRPASIADGVARAINTIRGRGGDVPQVAPTLASLP